MSEKYTKLFALPENLYAAGSPVILSAGHLLKDNETGKVLAQLKLKNIAAETIKAAKVRLHPQDTTGKPLEGAAEREYLDLQARTGDEFGQKAAIALPNASTRAFTVEIMQIIFDDNSIWEGTDAAWEKLPEPESLEKTLGDGELVKQYKIRYGNSSKVAPQEHKDIWLCACGTWNKTETCHKCKNGQKALFSLDLNELKAEKDARLADERAAEEAAKKKAAAAAKKAKKILSIVAPIAIVCIAALLTTKVFIPNSNYNKAVALMEAGQYDEAIAAFEALDGYKDSAAKVEEVKAKASSYAEAEALLAEGKTYEAATAFYSAKGYKDAWERCFALWGEITDRENISTGFHTVGLRADGTVVAVGDNDDGQCNVSDWTDIVAVSAGFGHTVGLRADGTVVVAGDNDGESDWTDVVAVTAGVLHTVGLRADGTVVSVGYNDDGQCNVSGWTNIVAISAGDFSTVGLRADGTVVAVWQNDYDQCDVSKWTDIVAISAGYEHTVGLRADGTVVAVGDNWNSECNVSDWTDVVAISAGFGHTVGLREDGTVLAVGSNYYGECDVSGWTDIVAISAHSSHTVGLRADGTVVAVGSNEYGQCDVSGWTDIKLPNK